jgi:Fe-S cluster assembly ATP-binding protein
MTNFLLNVQNLSAFIQQKQILNNFSLLVQKNEIHAILGPNGCGKSTFSKILAGHPSYSIESGTINFCEENLSTLEPEIRSHKGIFLAFQYPIEINGVTNYEFLRIAYNEKQKFLQKSELTPIAFFEFLQPFLTKLKIKSEFLERNINEGFSGGEKKRNEILQMFILEPKLIILDEIDSGLDIDALKFLSQEIRNNLPKNSSLILITHYPQLLQQFQPTHVHIMKEGKILKTGKMEVVDQLEKYGYDFFN